MRGFFTAYDAISGEKVWRFYTVLRDPVPGPQEQPELDLLYVAVGNDTPWNRELTSPGGVGALQLAFGRPYQTTGKNTNRLMVFKLNGKGLPERTMDTVDRAPVLQPVMRCRTCVIAARRSRPYFRVWLAPACLNMKVWWVF